MFNVRLAGGHLYGKQLFTRLSLMVSLMASFVLSFFPLDVLDEIWDLIESVSEGFLTYSFIPFSQEYSDSLLVAQLIYLSIVSCMLHVTVTSIKKQVSVFSIFILTVYQSLKSNIC